MPLGAPSPALVSRMRPGVRPTKRPLARRRVLDEVPEHVGDDVGPREVVHGDLAVGPHRHDDEVGDGLAGAVDVEVRRSADDAPRMRVDLQVAAAGRLCGGHVQHHGGDAGCRHPTLAEGRQLHHVERLDLPRGRALPGPGVGEPERRDGDEPRPLPTCRRARRHRHLAPAEPVVGAGRAPLGRSGGEEGAHRVRPGGLAALHDQRGGARDDRRRGAGPVEVGGAVGDGRQPRRRRDVGLDPAVVRRSLGAVVGQAGALPRIDGADRQHARVGAVGDRLGGAEGHGRVLELRTVREELERVAPGAGAGVEQAHGDAQGLPAAGAVPEDAAGHLDRRSTVALVRLPSQVLAVDDAVAVDVDVDVVVGARRGRAPVAPSEPQRDGAGEHVHLEELVATVEVQEAVAVGVGPAAAPVAAVGGVARGVHPRDAPAGGVGRDVGQRAGAVSWTVERRAHRPVHDGDALRRHPVDRGAEVGRRDGRDVVELGAGRHVVDDLGHRDTVQAAAVADVAGGAVRCGRRCRWHSRCSPGSTFPRRW